MRRRGSRWSRRERPRERTRRARRQPGGLCDLRGGGAHGDAPADAAHLRAQGTTGPVADERGEPEVLRARPGPPASHPGTDGDRAQPRGGAAGAAARGRAGAPARGAGPGAGRRARCGGGDAPPVPARPCAGTPGTRAVPDCEAERGMIAMHTTTVPAVLSERMGLAVRDSAAYRTDPFDRQTQRSGSLTDLERKNVGALTSERSGSLEWTLTFPPVGTNRRTKKSMRRTARCR